MSTRGSRKQASQEIAGSHAALTTADLVVLSLIAERPMHGYELVKEYERQEVEDWALVSRPHVYYALQKLAGRKLIGNTSASGEPGQRRKAVFHITSEGTQALRNALSSTSWAISRPPSAFNTWLGLSIHARQTDKHRVLTARRLYLDEQIAKEKLTLTQIGLDTSRRARCAAVMVGLCIEQFETELRWLTKIEAALSR